MTTVIRPPNTRLMNIRFVESECNIDALTDVYEINEDPQKRIRVTKSHSGDSMIQLWDQPRRIWDLSGSEYHKKLCSPPPPLTAEEQEALALLFSTLRLKLK